MKKIIVSILCVGLSFSAMARGTDGYYFNDEDEYTEVAEQVYYGPEKGSFAVSFSARPILNFVGNMFNGTTNQSMKNITGSSAGLFDGTTLDVKFYTSDNLAFTVGAGFNCGSKSTFQYDSSDKNDLDVKKTDKDSDMLITVGAQYLIRPGKRLQPVLGARLACMFGNYATKYNDYDNNNNDYSNGSPSFGFGIVGDLGVEYFFTKSVSLSAVADLGLYHRTQKSTKTSSGDKHNNKVSSSTDFMTGKLGGNLILSFYF